MKKEEILKRIKKLEKLAGRSDDNVHKEMLARYQKMLKPAKPAGAKPAESVKSQNADKGEQEK